MAQQDAKDLNWSLKPLTLWMNCIGVPLSPSCWSQLIRISVFFLVIFIETMGVFKDIFNARDISLDYYTDGVSTNTVSLNFIIDSSNFALYVIFGHAVLLTLTQSKSWEKLKHSFHQLEYPNMDFYPKFRQVVFFYVIYIIVSVLNFDWIQLNCLLSNNDFILTAVCFYRCLWTPSDHQQQLSIF